MTWRSHQLSHRAPTQDLPTKASVYLVLSLSLVSLSMHFLHIRHYLHYFQHFESRKWTYPFPASTFSFDVFCIPFIQTVFIFISLSITLPSPFLLTAELNSSLST